MILLDTCVLIWLATDQKSLSVQARKAIAVRQQRVCVSAISAFEIGMLCKRGRLKLPMSAGDWYETVVEMHGLQELTLTGRIVSGAVALEPIHNDPADRFIVATAKAYNLNIVTPDSMIRKYKAITVVW